MTYPYRDAYTHIEVSAIDKDGHVVGALVPNVTEDDSLSGCSSADPRKCHPQGQVYVGFSWGGSNVRMCMQCTNCSPNVTLHYSCTSTITLVAIMHALLRDTHGGGPSFLHSVGMKLMLL